MFGNFGWVGISVVGSAPVACLLFLAYQQAGIGVLMVAVPMAAMLLTTLHYFFRQQQAERGDAQAPPRGDRARGRSSAHATCASSRRASGASTAPSRTPRSAWRWCRPAGRVAAGERGAAQPARPGQLRVDRAASHSADFVDADDVALLNDRLARLNAKQVESFSVELQLRHGEGDEVWAAVHGSFFSDIETRGAEPDPAGAGRHRAARRPRPGCSTSPSTTA